MIVILEDDPRRAQQFTRQFPGALLTNNAAAVIALLRVCDIQYLSLDFDLGDPRGDNNGGVVSAFLRENPQFMPGRIVIHTMNPIGGRRMLQDLPGAILAPFEYEEI